MVYTSYWESDKMNTKKRENKIRARACQIFKETGNDNEKENWAQAEAEIKVKEDKRKAKEKPKTTYTNYSGREFDIYD